MASLRIMLTLGKHYPFSPTDIPNTHRQTIRYESYSIHIPIPHNPHHPLSPIHRASQIQIERLCRYLPRPTQQKPQRLHELPQSPPSRAISYYRKYLPIHLHQRHTQQPPKRPEQTRTTRSLLPIHHPSLGFQNRPTNHHLGSRRRYPRHRHYLPHGLH